MSLSSDLATYFSRVESTHGMQYLYRPEVLELLGSSSDFQAFSAALERLTPEARLLVLLRALGSQRCELTPRLASTELVVTFPGHDRISARHTLQIVRQMLAGAKSEVLVAGYAITEAGGLHSQLTEAARRGIRIVLICSSWKDRTGRTAADLTSAQWPADVPRPMLYEYQDASEHGAGMHVKCLLVDASDLLIGSANFTFPGLNTNVEMGVRLDGHVAKSARAVFDELLRTGRFAEIR